MRVAVLGGRSAVAIVDTHRPPRRALAKYRRQFESNAIIRASILAQSLGTTTDGWRVSADSSPTEEFLTEWGRECAIVAGEDADALELVSQISVGMDVEGEYAVEHVGAFERDVTVSLKPIAIPSLSYKTRPGQAMLLRKGDEARFGDVPTTRDGVAAAYVQNEGQRDRARALALADVTRFVRDSSPGSVLGTSAVESVSTRAEKIEEKFTDSDRAIKALAYGLYFAGFEPRKRKTESGSEEFVDEWIDDAKTEFVGAVGDLEPGDIIPHDGRINVEELAPGAPDIQGQLKQEIAYVIAGLPAPRYEVGWEKDINQFVTERQENSWDAQIAQRKRYIARRMSTIFRQVARERGYDDAGVEFLLEPPESDSPIESLDNDAVERIERYANAVATLSGTQAPGTVVDESALLSLVLQLPKDAGVSGFSDLEDQPPRDGEA